MESKKKKRKISGQKSNIQCETSDSDNSYTEDGDEDEDDGTENDDQCTEDSDECTEDDGSISSVEAEEHLSAEFDFDFMADVVKVLEDHAEVNMDNSIVLNRKLQDMLEGLKRKIVSMINKCREIYQENQVKIANPTTMISYLKGIGSCGRPFFKDSVGRFSPPNADYKYRSEVEKELFPSDLELFPHFTWTNRDKIGILQGIKEQAIEYIERKNSYEQKLVKSKPTALSKKVKLHSLKLKKLLDKVDDDFAIDWNQISVYNLGSRHTANSCLASWNTYLKPEINRDEWTDKENIKLNELVKKYQFQDWIAIASEMPHRSDYQCFVQYQTVVSIKMREDKGERWSKEEDDLLLSLVEKYRMGNVIRWNPICSQLPNRTKKQCFARWNYSINPNISRALFTPVEDCIILAAVEEFGENFNCFPKDLFPHRTVVQIRNRYNNSIKTRATTRYWTPEDDQLLLEQVAKYGEHDWTRTSEKIEGHTRTSCRTRYLTISKFLKDNPNATVEDIPRKKRNSRSNVTKSNWVETITGITEKGAFQEQESIDITGINNNKELYRSRLRNNELQWYNFLKYSYDFNFGESYSKVPKCLSSLEFVRYVFECKLNRPVVLQGHYATGFVPVTLQKLIRLHDQGDASLVLERPDVGFKLPPSYSTLLAFRGLCIQASFNDQQDKVAAIKNELSEHVRAARNKFRQRLESLLYKTTLLSRLEPKTSVEHNTFEVIYDINSRLGQIAGINVAEIKVAQTKKIAENILIAQNKADKNRQYKKKLEKTAQRGRNLKPNTSRVIKNLKPNTSRVIKNLKKHQPDLYHKTYVNKKAHSLNKAPHEVNLKDVGYSFQSKSPARREEHIIELEGTPQSKSLEKCEEILIQLEMSPRSMTEELPLKSNRKRRLADSLEWTGESPGLRPLESPVATKIVKYECDYE